MTVPQNLSNRLRAAGRDVSQAASAAAETVSANFRQSGNITVGGIASAVEGSISEITGSTVDLANSINGITGPALGAIDLAKGGLSNALQSGIRTAGGNLVSSLTSGLGGLLGGLMGGIGKRPNDLAQFASYNYVFTLGALTDFELNFPDLTYRYNEPLITILRTGGGDTRGSRTIYERNGKTEYYIDDVEIETIVAGNSGTRSTNATSINFKVTEPYSMGLFLQALQIAALSAGHKSYIEAPYVLSVEFKGYDQAGRPINARNSRRIFPLKFVNIEFEVTEGGSEYAVQAIPYHEEALTDQVQSTPTDTSFKGASVAEMLQTGVQSLATILNNNELQKVKANQKPKADQYIIMFPTETSSAAESAAFTKSSQGEGTQNSATTQGNNSQSEGPFEYREFTEEELQRLYDSSTGILNGDVPADFDAEIKKVLGISVKRSDLGESIREYAEAEENMNDIGKSKIVKSNLDAGQQAMGKARQCQSENTTGEIDRCRVQRSTDVRQMTFSAGKKIQDMIEEVILVSEYGRGIVDRKPDTNGMVDWFRIETNMYQITDSTNVDQTGKPARIYVYRVVPYKVHSSKFRSPTEASKGIQALKHQAVKQYDYIYTGKNDDIIDFDINFKAAFFTSIAGDFGQKTADSIDSATGEVAAGNKRTVTGTAPASTNDVNATKAGPNVVKGNQVDGGGVIIHPETQIARNFNDALVNSPVDLIAVDLTIWGDPYYITDSGMGNYNALQLPGAININSDGTMDYQSGEVDIEINFRTPLDYKGNWMEFPGGGFAPVGQFSGLYQVLFCRNSFSKGQFTQTLQTIRRPKQDSNTVQAAVDQTGAITTQDPSKQTVTTNTNAAGGNASNSRGGTGGQSSNGADDSAQAQNAAAARQRPSAGYYIGNRYIGGR